MAPIYKEENYNDLDLGPDDDDKGSKKDGDDKKEDEERRLSEIRSWAEQ